MKAQFVKRSFVHPEVKESFDNLRQRDSIQGEIARSILNNGFFTVAHNWDAEKYTEEWINFFKELGVSPSFIADIEELFDCIYAYDHPSSHNQIDWEEDEYVEGIWEDMYDISSGLDKQLQKDPELLKKLKEIANW